ncbi:MAG: aminopeptidase P family protein [Anaerolineae bacterium]|nr:aminopeptidase P family protein [Phycisphaerae bacterium]
MASDNTFAAAQAFLRRQQIDGWLVYDFRGNNPLLNQLLPGKRWTTRRAILFIPANGSPVLLNHSIDAGQFATVEVRRESYLSWPELYAWMVRATAGARRIAMDYAPGGTLPAVSIVDAGTVEMVRALGVDVVSSADLVQACLAVWSEDAQRGHAKASKLVTSTKDEAFQYIRQTLKNGGSVSEFEVQQNIVAWFNDYGLEFPEPPIVAANAHSGDPHFEVSEKSSATIKQGDWVLIDLWARLPGEENIFSDITWVGCAGEPSAKQREVFEVVKTARDACVQSAQRAWNDKQAQQGWQLDDAARDVIINAGYGDFIKHRTGHSLSRGPKVHGLGVNIDNLETHDTRQVLPGIGYTVEPGVYLPEFGARLEINVFVDPVKGPTITSCVQDEIVSLV